MTPEDYTVPEARYAPTAIDNWEQDQDTNQRTTIFNAFIFMQIFNWFHARKLYDEINIFEGFMRSPFFLPIVAFTAGFQVLMVEVAKEFMETRSQSWERWVLALIIGFCVWPWGMMLRLIPVKEAAHVQKRLDEDFEGDEDEEDEDPDYGKHAKLKMVQEVRKAQRELIKVNNPPPVRLTEPRNVGHLLRDVTRRIRVIRAFRGARGDVLAPRRSSGTLGHSGSNLEPRGSRMSSGLLSPQ